MKPILLALLLGLACPAAAQVGCTGQDLIAAMTPDERARLDAEVAKAPYPTGNHWTATRDGQVIHLVGTLHLYDERMNPIMARLAPVIAAAEKTYVEATDVEMEKLQREMAERPDLILSTGPTLPERLSKQEWAELSAAMTARGIPPFLASKFKPWYVSMLIEIPPCAMTTLSQGSRGLDDRIMQRVKAAGKPLVALEPYDTAFRVFEGLSEDEQLGMIRTALPLEGQAEDIFATLTASYFREENRQIWEFGRLIALDRAGDQRDLIAADFDKLDEALLKRRNEAWVAALLADRTPNLLVAVGAGHLAGEHGLLKLLEAAGFTLKREAF